MPCDDKEDTAVYPFDARKNREAFHDTTIDHIVPISKGTILKADRSNWQLAHATCNHKKGSRG